MKDNRIDFKFFLLPNITIEWDTPGWWRKLRKFRPFTYTSTKREREKEQDERFRDLEAQALQAMRQASQQAQQALYAAQAAAYEAKKDAKTLNDWLSDTPPVREQVDRVVSATYDGCDGWEIGLVDTEDNILYTGPLVANKDPIPLKTNGFKISGFWVKSSDGHSWFKTFDYTRTVCRHDTMELTYNIFTELNGARRERNICMNFEPVGV